MYAHRKAVRSTYTEQELMAILQADVAQNLSLRQIARERFQGRITHAVIHRALKGEFPTDPKKRTILGLPALRPAPVCPVCGEVHVTKNCRARAKDAGRPRRVAIRTDDMRSAARTIMRNLDSFLVSELLFLLEDELGIKEDE